MKTILFCGHGRAGKDEACKIFASLTGLGNAGTCMANELLALAGI